MKGVIYKKVGTPSMEITTLIIHDYGRVLTKLSMKEIFSFLLSSIYSLDDKLINFYL